MWPWRRGKKGPCYLHVTVIYDAVGGRGCKFRYENLCSLTSLHTTSILFLSDTVLLNLFLINFVHFRLTYLYHIHKCRTARNTHAISFGYRVKSPTFLDFNEGKFTYQVLFPNIQPLLENASR